MSQPARQRMLELVEGMGATVVGSCTDAGMRCPRGQRGHPCTSGARAFLFMRDEP